MKFELKNDNKHGGLQYRTKTIKILLFLESRVYSQDDKIIDTEYTIFSERNY